MKYLGVDFGLRRIGLSASNGDIASPKNTIEVKGFKDALKKIIEVVNKEEFTKVIVGLPQGKMGKAVCGFVNALRKTGLNVETADETLSTKRANSQMIEAGFPVKKRRVNDAYAASIILQDWLDNR